MHDSEYHKIFQFEANHWWFEGRRRLLRYLLETHLPCRGASILDVGCGTGHHLLFLKQLGYERANGMDFSSLAIEFCRRLGLANVSQGDATALDYPDQQFDALLVLDVLEHLRDDEAALREFWRVLRPGGLVILTVPAFRALWSNHDVVLQHYRRYRFKEFAPLSTRNRFSIKAWSYFFFTVFPLVVTVRLASRISPLRRTSDLEAIAEPFNTMLKMIASLEVKAMQYIHRLPFGTSLAVVLHKPA